MNTLGGANRGILRRLLATLLLLAGTGGSLLAQVNGKTNFAVSAYALEGNIPSASEEMAKNLTRFTGTNVDVTAIVEAAAMVQSYYRKISGDDVSVAVATQGITNGVATLYVFHAAVPQILISGKRYFPKGDTNTAVASSTAKPKAPPASTTAATTNRGPVFQVSAYQISGNTLLSTNTLKSIFVKYTGTNIGVAEIEKAGSELQMEYRDRGFPTVNVTIPPQQITNHVVKLKVFEGRLSEIVVANNHYFSSNNIMRSLPGLHTNMMLNGPVFQAELDRANANQDRQISPQIEPGPDLNTTLLRLNVKDRLPLHAKMELNNQNSPGTPVLRLNSSAVYGDLWQLEHSLGFQYSFSPEQMKAGNQWAFYDRPLVANYSGFYRLPLGSPEAVSDVVAANPSSFGYNEGTRKFQLPPPSGVPELNMYASRATIDTGVNLGDLQTLYNVPGVRQVFEQDAQQDLTVNNTIGFRLTDPLPEIKDWNSSVSGGLDYKTYELNSFKTNNFQFTDITVNENGTVNPPIVSTVTSPVPLTHRPLNYLPLVMRYDGSLRDSLGTTSFGLGVSGNLWYSGNSINLHNVTGSTQSSGHWVTVTPNLSRDFTLPKNWMLTLKADGQWSSEPLLSTEQFGIGGVNSVRGYHEGEIFGDSGWHVSLEQKTPPHVIGLVGGKDPLTVRGTFYVDYAEAYLLDPLGRSARTSLWSAGFGTAASLGAHWEARLLFSCPFLNAGLTEALQPGFNFSLTAQF